MWSRIRSALSRPVDGASLAFLRAAVGTVVALEAFTLLRPRVGGSWLVRLYTGPNVHWNIPYPGFEWLHPWHEPLMTWHVVAMGVAGLLLTVGWFTRAASIASFLGWTYVALLEEAQYNNHYYLLSILVLLLSFMPTGRCWSVDRWLRHGEASASYGGPDDVPFWTLFLLRGQLLLVYFYGGVAKLSYEWLSSAEPVRSTLAEPVILAPLHGWLTSEVIARLHAWISQPEVAFGVAYVGTVFDLLIGLLLLVRRTRILGVVLMCVFHGLNHWLLFDDIGWFPLLGITSMTIFLEPDWPRRVARWLRRPVLARPDVGWLLAGVVVVPVFGAALGWKLAPTQPPRAGPVPLSWVGVALIGLWLAVQAVVPLRHFFIPGNVNWTCEGDRFSWRMKATNKVLGTFQIRLDDAALLNHDEQGLARINWTHWNGARRIYRHVDAPTFDWASHGEFVVLYQPLCGERIVYNAASRDAPAGMSAEESRRRIDQVWQAAYGRRPRIEETRPLVETLVAVGNRLARLGADEKTLAIVRRALGAAERLKHVGAERTRVNAVLGELRTALIQLHTSRHANKVQNLMARVHPFAVDGRVDAGGVLLAIEDAALERKTSQNLRLIDREHWRSDAFQGADFVYADLERFSLYEWLTQPRAYFREDADGQVELLWNHYRDLTRYQDGAVRARPYRCYQYAQRVAKLWTKEHGRRPGVYVTNIVQLKPHAAQLLLDPRADLARAPINWFWHNDWIMPLE